jgi:hypothetical protein
MNRFVPLTRFEQKVGAIPPHRERWLLGGSLTLFALLLLAILLLPGATYIGKYIQDILIFYDAADRITDGQVPNRDFHTALGPLALGLPALGLWISGTLGGMFPAATAVFTLLLLPLLIYACVSRLPLLYGLGFGVFILLLAITPLNPGDAFDSTSYAMFYNRFGWVLLSLLVLFALPRRAGTSWIDAAVIAALVLGMFYLKISYAALAVPFVLGLAFLSPLGRAGIGGLIAALLSVLIVEIFWGGTGAYISDIRMAGKASGALAGGPLMLALRVFENITWFIVFALLVIVGFLRGVSWGTLLLVLYAGAAGLLIVNQNALTVGIINFIPAGILCVLAPSGGNEADAPPMTAVGAALIAVLAMPLGVTLGLSLLYQSMMASKMGGSGPYQAQLDGLWAREGHLSISEPPLSALRAAYRAGVADLPMLNVARHANLRMSFGQSEYLQTVLDGIQLLNNPEYQGSVFVLDMANPFNAALDRKAPLGVEAWNHLGRTFTKDIYRPAEQLFADVDLVLDPKMPTELGTNGALHKVYDAFLKRNFYQVAESDYWRLFKRRQQDAR